MADLREFSELLTKRDNAQEKVNTFMRENLEDLIQMRIIKISLDKREFHRRTGHEFSPKKAL